MKSPILILSVLTLVFAGCKDFTNQDGSTKMPLVHKGEIIFPEDEYNSVKDAVVFKAEMEELFIYNEKRIEGLKIKASHVDRDTYEKIDTAIKRLKSKNKELRTRLYRHNDLRRSQLEDFKESFRSEMDGLEKDFNESAFEN